MFLKFHNQRRGAEHTPLLASPEDTVASLDPDTSPRYRDTNLETASDQIFFIIFAHTSFFVFTAVGIAPLPDTTRDLGHKLFRGIIIEAFHWLCVFAGLL